MDAIILAGGLGSRLKAELSDRPKPMAEIDGKPFLDILLEQIAAWDEIDKVVLALGHLGEKVKEYYRKNPFRLHLEFSCEAKPLLTGGAARLACEKTSSNTVLVMNGDSFVDFSFPSFAAFHREKSADITLVSPKVENASRFGALTIEKDGRLRDFREKQEIEEKGEINGGVYLIERRLLECYEINQPFSLEREAFLGWLKKRFFAFKSDGFFIDIGTPESYEMAKKVMKKVK